MGGQPLGQHLRVEGDERPDVGAVVAHHDDVRDERVRRKGLLEDLGGDVLAARGNDELLLASRDAQVTAIVDGSEVAGLEPAVDVGLGSCLGQVVVALRHGDAAHEQLAVGSNLHPVAGPGEAHRIRREVLWGLHGDRSGRLGEAVSLQERDAQATIEVCQVRGQGRATRNDGVQIRPEHRTDLLQDERVGDAATQLERCRRTGGGRRGSIGDGRGVGSGTRDGGLGQGRVHVGGGRRQGTGLLDSPGKDSSLRAATGLRGGSVIDLLHDARNHEEHRRFECRNVVDEITGVGGEGCHALAREQAVHDEAREHVGDRQEEQGARLRVVDEHRQEVVGLQHRRNEVAVREDDALGHARRAGRINDRRLVAELDGVGALAHLLDRDTLGGTRQDALGTSVEGEDMADALGAHGFDELGLLGVRRGDDAHVGVLEDVRDLGGGVRLVDRHGDGATGQCGHIDERPLVGGGCQDRQVLAGLEAHADETARNRVGFAQERLHGDPAPRADVGTPLNRDLSGVRCHALVEHLRQVHVLGCLSRCDRLP